MKSLLLVANYDSGVGYAWWLMESYWTVLAQHYSPSKRVILVYPVISQLPQDVADAPLEAVEQDFSGTNPGQVLRQCRFLRRHRVWAVYFSDRPTWHWRYILYRLCGVRLIVVHDHTPGLRTPARGLKGILKRLIHRLPWLSADGAVGATDFVRKRLIEVNGMPPAKTFAAPNGLPDADHPPGAVDPHALFSIPESRKIIVMTARANRYKGVDFALKCFARLRNTGKQDFHFLFIGDGPDLEDFKKAAEDLMVQDHCTFAGKRDDIPALIAGANLAFHPSKGEVGYSLSILEYMRAGLPVVVPDNPSVCRATNHGKNGMIYPPEDVNAASEMIDRLLSDDSLRSALGVQARTDAGKYKLETSHLALLNAFEKIAHKSGKITK
ncbi:glycosyltransferase involved in cell wall biosynthesis [Desulfosalsimonas propionicica]|uniref:Glycosyltransferase involved in cell wall biosynthesis n=1 Tax=Desulfosalsimonas propionicica TaxID=332175 RepID=A0A7W0HM55_9BACT|nr:glycosyltransferase family 4 protein [Desulfosalsimonas propionicica]MBA2883008.1 glycosyltransferase involved in cell wall biosynthesis [Desulfosalsimonas propionicica]